MAYGAVASVLYSILAQVLPQEGRDYQVEIVESPGGQPKITLSGLNPLGNAWVPFAIQAIRRYSEDMKKGKEDV